MRRERTALCLFEIGTVCTNPRMFRSSGRPAFRKGLLLALALLALVPGCSRPSPSPDAPSPPYDSLSLKLSLFQGGYGEEYWKELIAAFRQAYPGTAISYKIHPRIGEIILPELLSGSAPDVLYLSDSNTDGVVPVLIHNRSLTDLTGVFDGPAWDSDKKIRDMILPGLLESPKYAPYGDGQIFLAPVSYGPLGLVYNSTLLARRGWPLPTTWDEFYALGETAKRQGIALMTYPGIYPGYLESLLFPAIADAAGMDGLNRLFNMEERSVDNPQVRAAAERVAELAGLGYLMPGSGGLSHHQAQSAVLLDEALFIPNGVWIQKEMAGSPRTEGFAFALMVPPTVRAGSTRYVQISCEQIMIPKDAENPAFAKEFLRFLYTDRSVTLFAEKANGVLARVDALELAGARLEPSTRAMYAVLGDESTVAFPGGFLPVPASVAAPPQETLLSSFSAQVLGGRQTVSQWAEAMEICFAELRSLRGQWPHGSE